MNLPDCRTKEVREEGDKDSEGDTNDHNNDHNTHNNDHNNDHNDDFDEQHQKPDTNVTETFDRSQKYYRVLRPSNIEWKYRPGLNCNDGTHDDSKLYWPIEANEHEGGFYFTDAQNIVQYMLTWGERICDVTVPKSATIYRFDEHATIFSNAHPIWRASEIILSEPKLITKELLIEIISQGGMLNKSIIVDILDTLRNKKYTDKYETELTIDEVNRIIQHLEFQLNNLI